MTPMLITVVLTVLAALVVVLTRVRMVKDGGGAGRLAMPTAVLNTHTLAGAAALVLWSVFLVGGPTALGWLGLLLWWVTVVAGLLVLARWMPARGRHSSGSRADAWGGGPGLSVLAHVGLLVGVLVFTSFLATGRL